MWRAVLLPLLGLSALGTACSPSSSGAPPLKICGTTLYSGASGAVVTDATGTRPVVGIATGGDPVVVVRFVNGCSRGATFAITPPGAGKVERVAYAKDQHAAAAILRVGRTPYEVTVRHPGGRSGLVRVIPAS